MIASPTLPNSRTTHVAPMPLGSPLGLYLHVPFCAHICPYCDFNTYAGQDALIPRYVDALCHEIRHRGERLAQAKAGTVFFGGGTPSLLSPEAIGDVLAACRSSFDLASDAEITLEANPNGLTAGYLERLLQVGVNRLSIGAQTLDRRGLRSLGRLHEASDVTQALAAARTAGFTSLSLDLIFGWPRQTLAAWRHDLTEVLAGGENGIVPDHLSLYSLIVEPGTPMFEAVSRGILSVPDDDAAAEMYELAIEVLARAGWTHYEVANWARRPECASQHNLIYWRNGEYLGAGAGAHGQIQGERWMNHLFPATYCEAIERKQLPVSNVERLPDVTTMAETMMLGLRLLQEGVDADAFRVRHGVDLSSHYGPVIDELVVLGLLRWSERRLTLTPRGLMLANDVCARFV